MRPMRSNTAPNFLPTSKVDTANAAKRILNTIVLASMHLVLRERYPTVSIMLWSIINPHKGYN